MEKEVEEGEEEQGQEEQMEEVGGDEGALKPNAFNPGSNGGQPALPYHGGGEGERDGEPHEAAEEVPAGGGGGLGRDGGLPVRLVNEHGTEVAGE